MSTRYLMMISCLTLAFVLILTVQPTTGLLATPIPHSTDECPSDAPRYCTSLSRCCSEKEFSQEPKCVPRTSFANCSSSASCGQESTCCRFANESICCPFEGATCCLNSRSCCPKGYTCSTDGSGSCISQTVEKSAHQTASLKPVPLHQQDNSNLTAWYFNSNKDVVIKSCWDLINFGYCSKSAAQAAANECFGRRMPPNTACSQNNSTCYTIDSAQGSCYADPQQCLHPVADTCDWYTNCLNFKLRCQPSDYPLMYGYPYCKRFLATKPKFNAKGQQWVHATMECLQTSLLPIFNTPIPCGDIREVAFKSHPYCYTSVTPSFCEIGWANVEVLLSIYRVKDFENYDAIVQVIETVYLCLKRGFPGWERVPMLPLVPK